MNQNQLFNLPTDSLIYYNINTTTKNGFVIPIIFPDDGVTYIVEAKNYNGKTINYSYSNPEKIFNILSIHKIKIEPLACFIQIMAIIHKNILEGF
jgi:hypothetical protein